MFGWDSIKYVFQLPISWLKELDRRSWLIGDGTWLRVNRNSPDGTEISFDESRLPDIPSSESGSPTNREDDGSDDDSLGDTWTWFAGGDNGFTMDVYCRIQENDGWHYLSRATLEFSKDGLLVAAQGKSGRRLIQG